MSSSSLVLEGVFAINKPPAISSAQVIRDVQEHFNPSKLFAPWLAAEAAKRDVETHNQRQKRKWRGRQKNSVKMGHGGTLDPMATGVLILGVGNGTKALNHFTTECVKSYEAVVLFGAATDTYDTEGKVVSKKPFEHITREMVEEKLGGFRGKGMQKPPIFSALRVQGKRLYEYAREGKEVPVEIQERPVEVHELEIIEWFEGGTHEWFWPEREAEVEEKKLAQKALNIEGEVLTGIDTADEAASLKRKREDDVTQDKPVSKLVKSGPTESATLEATGQKPETTEEQSDTVNADLMNDSAKAVQAEAPGTRDQPSGSASAAAARTPCPAPACRIRMTVTSGFYVRSLLHDLGAAVGSLGCMTALVRTRQGDFKLGENVLGYEELKQGEEVWGPKVQAMLEGWMDQKENVK